MNIERQPYFEHVLLNVLDSTTLITPENPLMYAQSAITAKKREFNVT